MEDFTLAPLEIPVTSKFVRQAQAPPCSLEEVSQAVCTNLKEGCSLEVKTASLTGGVATLSRHLTPGTQVQLRFQVGMKLSSDGAHARFRAQDMAFESWI